MSAVQVIADLDRKLAAQVEHVAALEQRLMLARERATVAEGKLANAVAREQMVAKAVAEFERRLSVSERKPTGAEPTFMD